MFPQDMHAAMRSAIAFNTKGIVAQKLLKSIKPNVGRVPAVEVMFFSPIIKKLILEGEDHKLPDAIRIGADDGMQDFTTSLKQLIDDNLIDRATAFAVAPNVDALKMALKGIDVRASGLTERKRAEQRFQDLVHGIDTIAWEADAVTLKITFVNDKAEEIMGYPTERWFTDPDFLVKLIHPDDRERILPLTQSAISAGGVLHDHDGRTVPNEIQDM